MNDDSFGTSVRLPTVKSSRRINSLINKCCQILPSNRPDIKPIKKKLHSIISQKIHDEGDEKNTSDYDDWWSHWIAEWWLKGARSLVWWLAKLEIESSKIKAILVFLRKRFKPFLRSIVCQPCGKNRKNFLFLIFLPQISWNKVISLIKSS